MGSRMKKGLFNGLRYFSNIFDPKEQEMQIGYPTDVKHVAHIGWDGPSVNNPSWMNEFRSAPLTATVIDDDAADIPKFPSSEFVLPDPKPLEKPSRRKKSSEKSSDATLATNSPKRDSSTAKHSRRRRSSAGGSGGESADGSRGGRKELRERHADGAATGEHEPPSIPKQPRRRRTKGSSSNSGGGESSRSRSRAHGGSNLCTQEGREEFMKPVTMGEEIAS